MRALFRPLAYIFFLAVLFGAVYFWSMTRAGERTEPLSFVVPAGANLKTIATDLAERDIIRSETFFIRYMSLRGQDRRVQAGEYTLLPPFTLSRVADALREPKRGEREVTILPGWDLRDIAEYLVKQGFASSTDEVYAQTGYPAKTGTSVGFLGNIPILKQVPEGISLEGYIAPNTFRVFQNATLEDVLYTLIEARADELVALDKEIAASGKSVHGILTLASVVEREVRSDMDRKKVADIFWRRLDVGMGLEADSTVHYLTGKGNDVFTTAADRATENLWNTYKYAGMPAGPIATPSISSIRAVLFPEKNDAWFFLTTLDTGEVKYSRTLREHEQNIARYFH